jgi:REP element-mobilizing transposase RayT
MADTPVGYFLTWTAYSTWLPGDERGWVDGATHEVQFEPAPQRERQARQLMVESPVALTQEQRSVVDHAIRDHCRIRRWELHTVNVRVKHVHVVVSLPEGPKKALREFKAWATRRLKERNPGRVNWWTEGGSKRWLWTDEDLEQALIYVRDFQ